jgi:hypothetical protein
MLFVLSAIVLAAGGLYYRAQNAHHAQELANEFVQFNISSPAVNPYGTPLKDFVDSHMGATVKYTLQGSYDRIKAAADASAAAASSAQSSNSQVYADAQRACSGHTDSITQARCNAAYIAAHSASITATPTPVPAPKLADYQVTLRSPLWTPDLPGALFLGAVLALLFAVFLTRRRHL